LKAKKTGNVIRGDCVLWYRKDEILEAENKTKILQKIILNLGYEWYRIADCDTKGSDWDIVNLGIIRKHKDNQSIT
jgi:hypothetical protein